MWLEVTGTGSDCSRVECSAGTLAMYLGSDIKRHLKQDLGTQEKVPELRHFPTGATES